MNSGFLRSVITAAVLSATALLSGCEGSQRSAQGATVARSSSTPLTRTPFPMVEEAPAATASPISALLPPPAKETRDVRMPTNWRADLNMNGNQRLAHAKQSKAAEVQKLFDAAGVTFPPHDVLYRAFKKEGEFEVWAGDKDKPMKLIATYGICAASGELGPKRNEGDLQVPEGYYKVGYFHPMSQFYLSAQVDYPNASDKLRGGPSPGSDILIHGRCASIGCLSMTDERIEEIYLVGWGAFMKGRPTNIQIFPARDMDALLSDPAYTQHHEFWREIKPGYDLFEKTHKLPTVRIERDGRYVIAGEGVL